MSSTANTTTESKTNQDTDNGDELKLFIGGIPRSLTLDNLRLFFQTTCDGPILDVAMPVNRLTGNFRGFGFVGFKNKADYDKVLSLSQNKQLVIMGKNVEAKVITEQLHHNKPSLLRQRYNNYNGYNQYGRTPQRPFYGGMPQNYYPYPYNMQAPIPPRGYGGYEGAAAAYAPQQAAFQYERPAQPYAAAQDARRSAVEISGQPQPATTGGYSRPAAAAGYSARQTAGYGPVQSGKPNVAAEAYTPF